MSALRRCARFVAALLRELSDETAYRRYLQTNGREHSRQEWRRFSDEHLRRKYLRARCC